MVSGDGVFGRLLDHESGAIMNAISTLMGTNERDPGELAPLVFPP